MRRLKSTIFVALRNFFSCEHRIARFLKMNSVLALVYVSAVFKNHQIKLLIHCVTRLRLFDYLSSSGRGYPFIEMVRQTRLPFMQTVRGNGKCSKIRKKPCVTRLTLSTNTVIVVETPDTRQYTYLTYHYAKSQRTLRVNQGFSIQGCVAERPYPHHPSSDRAG